MATYTLGLYSNSTFVNMYDGATYTGGLASPYRIEYDQAEIQNITVTDTQTGTASAFDYTNTNTSGNEGVTASVVNNDTTLNGGAYTGGQTVDEYVAPDGTVYYDVPIVASESYQVRMYDALSGGTLLDTFWVTSVYLDLDGDGVKDANENDFFVSTRDLSTIPETYRLDFHTYNSTSNDNGIGYVTAENTTIPGPVDGTAGDDVMDIGYVDADGDTIDGADGNDDTIYGYEGNDSINAGAGNDTVYGGTGNDTIVGGTGRDIIYGEDGDDSINVASISFGQSFDTVYGGAGNDTVTGNFFQDSVLDGGDGIDDLVVDAADNSNNNTYFNMETGVLEQTNLPSGTTYTNTAVNFENAYTGAGADTIIGTSGDNIISTGAGDDTVDGGGGNDSIDGGAGNDSLNGGDGNDTIIGGAGSDTIDGGAGDDYIDLVDSTPSAPDVVDAGTGNDTVKGYFGNDTLDGGDGTDLIDYSNIGAATPVDIDLAAGTANISGVTYGTQTVTNFEDATGTFGDDTIAGTDGANVLDGGPNGDDTILGRGGDDTIYGGTGNDSIDGGTGNDTIDGGDGNDTIYGGDCEMEWQAGGSTPSYLETDPAPNGTNTTTQNFTNSDGDTVTLTNTTTNGEIDESGAFGPVDDAHRLTETGEVNTHSFSQPVSGVQMLFTASSNGEKYTVDITLADGTVMSLSEAIAAGHLSVDTSASDETIDGDDIVGGNSDGNADSTFITVHSPILSIDVTSTGTNAGAIAYELYVDTNAPVQVEVDGTGDDTILGGAGDDVIDGGCGNDTIDGGADNDLIDGGTGDDILTGGSGDDTFTGLSGHDTITDFNTGNTGAIDDGDQTNNDFVDLSAYYNQANLDIYNAANPDNTYDTPLQWLRADQADGVLNDTEAGWDADNTLTIQNGGSAVAGDSLTFDNTNVACFTRGTLINTIDGEIPVEDLSTGDLVKTVDNGFQPVRWIGTRKFSSEQLAEHKNLRAVRIRAGAFGNGLPETDLLVSQQHRILISSKIAQRMFDGHNEILVAAKHLVVIDGIDIVETDGVEYYHLLFDNHQIVFSNGARTESMYTGPEALKTVSPEVREEILTIFPEIASIDYEALSCRPLANGRMGRKLAMRHKNNGKQLFAENGL